MNYYKPFSFIMGTLETLGDHWRPLATISDMLENDQFPPAQFKKMCIDYGSIYGYGTAYGYGYGGWFMDYFVAYF